jgi:predicted site-specific integrase-resolvase
MNDVNQAMTLRKWADGMGLSYRTAWRMVRMGKLPNSYRAVKFKTGTIRIIEVKGSPPVKKIDHAVVYARINSRSEESDMDEQIRVCRVFCLARGWQVERVICERAPGFGPKRRRLHALLVSPPAVLVVATPSVLSRFDIAVTEILLRNLGCQLVVVDRDREFNGTGGALEDLTDAISATCHLHYGLKRGRALVEDLNRLVAKRSQR